MDYDGPGNGYATDLDGPFSRRYLPMAGTGQLLYLFQHSHFHPWWRRWRQYLLLGSIQYQYRFCIAHFGPGELGASGRRAQLYRTV